MFEILSAIFAVFCMYCGQKLRDTDGETDSEKATTKRSRLYCQRRQVQGHSQRGAKTRPSSHTEHRW